MTSVAVQFERWSASRGAAFAIGPIDLCVNEGCVLTLMGPSGIGKTTFLLTVLGYREIGLHTTGCRTFWGAELQNGAVPARSVYIPQNLPFNPNFEVEAFLLKLPWGRELRRRIRRDRVSQVLRELDLNHRRRATVGELSGGEATRAGLAQVILMRPKFLVGDEMVQNLDPGMALEVLGACRKLVRSEGGVALFSLHSVEAAMQVSDSIAVLFPHDLLSQPILVHRESNAWHGDWVHCLVTLSRSMLRFRDCAAARRLLHELSADPDSVHQSCGTAGVRWLSEPIPPPALRVALLRAISAEPARARHSSFCFQIEGVDVAGVRLGAGPESEGRILVFHRNDTMSDHPSNVEITE